jgi:nucleotide-binding universal stress UspA family protein
MTFKTILTYCDAGRGTAERLSVATDLAANFESDLVGLHVRPPFQPPLYFDDGFAMDQLYKIYEENLVSDEKAATSAFRRATEGKNIAVARETRDGPVGEVVTRRARYADLVVLSQPAPDAPLATPSDLPETVALASGRPVLVIPYIEAKRPIGRNVLLCWNASRESARAAVDALPFLEAADKVTVLAIRTNGKDEDLGVADAASWLARHGIKANVVEETADDIDVGELILSQAADLDADLIVMGVYGHGRVREIVPGGASRTLLKSMTVPVLIAH